MVSAAALSALTSSIVPYTTLFLRSRQLRKLPRDQEVDLTTPIMFPLSILSASNGILMKANVPIDPISLQVWEPRNPGQGCEIAGVPGKDEPGIEIEMPLESNHQGSSGLVTSRVKDLVKLEDGKEVSNFDIPL